MTPSASTTTQRPRGMAGWREILVTLVLIIAAVAAVGVIDTAGSAAPAAANFPAAQRFLRTYVTRDGQVVRPDQGGDTVSEGQAYGMLIAEGLGDWREFARIWNWTRTHLQQPDALLAYHAAPDGHVLDTMPASDADLLAAWALTRASGPPGQAGPEHRAGIRIAYGILAHETTRAEGLPVLAAGPWATGSPASLDPSYWAIPAFTDLARVTRDRGFAELAESARQLTRSLTGDGRTLPPDWARLDGNTASPEPAPNGSAPQARYGLDAQRLVVWMAASCSTADRGLAAAWWRSLTGAPGAIALSPTGQTLDPSGNAVPLIASASAARAAGRLARANGLLARAEAQQAEHPTYYGGAWLALNELLGASRLTDCHPSPQGGA